MSSLIDTIVNILKQILCGGGGQQSEPIQQQQPYQQPYPHPQQQQQQYEQQYPLPQQQQQQYQSQPQPQHNQHQQHPQRPQQQHQPNHHAPSPHPPEHKPLRKKVEHYHNQNMINQNNEQYKSLRDQARHEGSEMARCFDEAHKAHENGDGGRAKHLSDEGHKHQHEMERLNAQASDWIFKQNNLDSGPGEVDLHGLYVKEAITHTDTAIQAAQNRGDAEIHLIVGKGLHSAGHVAKIKPAIEELMIKHNLSAHLDPHNEGVLIVNLTGRDGGMSADEMTRRLERDDESCIIM